MLTARNDPGPRGSGTPRAGNAGKLDARMIGVVLLLLLSGTALAFLPLREILGSFLEWAQTYDPWGAFLLASLFVPACILLLPGTPITLACGFTFGFLPTLVAVVLFSNLGAQAAFLCGRSLVRERVRAWVERSERRRAVDRAMGQLGFRLVFLLRLSPLLPFNAMNYVLSATPVRFRHYAAGTFVGMLPGNVLYCFVAAAMGEAGRSWSDGDVETGTAGRLLLWIGVAASLGVAVLLTRHARRALASALPAADDES